MNKKKISPRTTYLIVILLSLLITLVTITYLRLTNNEGIYFVSDLTTNFREEVYISNFISYIDGTLIDDYKIDTSKVGIKEVNVNFKNKYGFIVSKNFNIIVKDVTPPMVVVNNPYTIVKSSIKNLEEEIFCADDYDDLISCEIIGEYDLDRVGKYDLKIKAKDNSNNTTEKSFTLNVVDKTSNSNTKPNYSYTSFKEIYKKYKNKDNLIGLDISMWQGDVDYTKLKNEGVDFVMLKIGGQTKINGEYNIDPKFYKNIEGAIDNDIKVGVYFYSYAKTEEAAIKQADFVVEILKDYKIDMPIAFDWENWKYYTKFHISFNTLNNVASTFINRVEELGYKGVLYSSKYYLENIWYSNDYTNWIAYYTSNFNEYKDYYMWQMCSNGKINGIDGYVDIDIMNIR